MKYLRCLFILPVLFAAACAHHRDVRPGAEGVNYVVVRSPTRESAEQSAIHQATDYCESIDQRAEFISEKSDYKGSMDEGTRNTVRQASMAAMVLGGGTGVLAQDHNMRNGGAVVGTAGTVGTIMTSGDDYVADMKFKCR